MDTDRHVRGSSARAVLRYVRRVRGEEAAAAVLATAASRDGHTGDPAGWVTSWMSHEAICHLADAAGEACGDPDIGRRAGEEGMRTLRERGIADLLRDTGSVAAAVGVCVDGANKNSDGRLHRVVRAGDGVIEIEARYVPPGEPAPFFCGYLAGFLVAVPGLFDGDGVVAETHCMGRGDASCRYELRWTLQAAAAGAGPAGVPGTGADVAERFIERFEQLHTMATELAQAEDLDTLLERITDRASTAVRARRHVLAIQPGDGRLRVHHRGFVADQVDRFVERLLADELGGDQSYLVVDVASATRHYGRMAAVFPRGASVNELERRLMHAYARHAAAALESVSALETARADRDTARALLTLAHALSEVGSRADVGRRVATAVPLLAPCDRAHVWLWDADAAGLRLEGRFPELDVSPEEAPVLSPDRHAGLVEQLSGPAPFVVARDATTAELRCLLDAANVDRAAVVPIRRRGEFLGVVLSGVRDGRWSSGTDVERDLLARLGGLADQAATALENAALLDRVREQSLHDPLTGLPNRALVQERAEHALALAARSGDPLSLLFIDLDRFKQVNDSLGHAAGDELIRAVADRLRPRLRSCDTLGRLGGDEFVVLLPQAAAEGAVQVAEFALTALSRPFDLTAGTAHIGASIGIATAPTHGTDYDALLRYADDAMYRAKADGRGRFCQPA